MVVPMLLLFLSHFNDRLPAIRENPVVLREYVGRRKRPGEKTQFFSDCLVNLSNDGSAFRL